MADVLTPEQRRKNMQHIWCEESAVQRGSHRFIQTRIRPLHAVQYADSRKV